MGVKSSIQLEVASNPQRVILAARLLQLLGVKPWTVFVPFEVGQRFFVLAKEVSSGKGILGSQKEGYHDHERNSCRAFHLLLYSSLLL